MEFSETTKGKPLVIYNGHQYVVDYTNKEEVTYWRCINFIKNKCKGRLKTKNNTVLGEGSHVCIPDEAANEVRKHFVNAKKRARETDTTISTIYAEDVGQLFNRGYDLVTSLPSHRSAKQSLHRIRRKNMGPIKDPTDSEGIILQENHLLMNDGSNFLLEDDNRGPNDRILVFASENGKSCLSSCLSFFIDGTFKSSSKQFGQLFVIHADLGSSWEETNTIPAVYALLPNKKRETYDRFFKAIKTNVPGWSPTTLMMDFEIAIVQSARSLFPETEILGCNYHFNQCLWKKVQYCGLVSAYKENEEIRCHIRMCSALAHLPLEMLDDGWLCIQESSPENQKLQEFYDYFVDQWLDNEHMPRDMWNCSGRRHRTNNVSEGWNQRINRLISRVHPNVYSLIKNLREDAEYYGHQFDRLVLNMDGKRRKKSAMKTDETISKALQRLQVDGNLKSFLACVAYSQKLQ